MNYLQNIKNLNFKKEIKNYSIHSETSIALIQKNTKIIKKKEKRLKL